MRSVEQRPHYHTVLIQYTIQLASQVSISAYDKIRQLLFLKTRKHAKKCESNLVFGKYGTIKEGYQVHAVRGCSKLAKCKGWINLKEHKKSGLFGQRCNDNQEGYNSFKQEDHKESNYWVCYAWILFGPRDYVQKLCLRCDEEGKRKWWFYLPIVFARRSCWKSLKFSLLCQGIGDWHQSLIRCCSIQCFNIQLLAFHY